MSMIQALGNVSKVRGALIFVEDPEAELAFYRDVIGLRLLYRTRTFIRFDATQGTSLSLISGGTPVIVALRPSSGACSAARMKSARVNGANSKRKSA